MFFRIPMLWAIFWDTSSVSGTGAYMFAWLFALGIFSPWVGVANKAIIAEW